MSWHVVNTQQHQEARAELNLTRQGFRAWLPVMQRIRRHARKIDTVRVPVFPGYLFVELDCERGSWAPINGTFGVRRLLLQGARPAPVPDHFIESLRATTGSDGLVTVPAPKLVQGQSVRIVAGPFADYIASVLLLAPGDRVKVLLNVMGGEVSAVVARELLVSVA